MIKLNRVSVLFDVKRHPGKQRLIASLDACAAVGFSRRDSKLGSFMNPTAKLQISKTRFTADLQIVWMVTCKRLVIALYGALIIQELVLTLSNKTK